MLALGGVTGCSKGDGPPGGAAGEGAFDSHAALIAEFHGYRDEHCACPDSACREKLAREKIAPRVDAVMSRPEKLPYAVQIKLGDILRNMMDCAQRVRVLSSP